ncbi:MAG: protein kinase [Akkermansiaceae bacterium]
MSGAIGLTIGSVTTAGTKPANEDFSGVHLPDDETLVTKGITAVIADGVSAARAAREASETAVRGFLADYYETPESWSAKTSGHRVLTSLNRWLCNQGQVHGAAERGCVTTFTAIILKSQTGHLFHIGDTRVYRLRGDDFEQLTSDHTTSLADGVCHLDRALGITVNVRIDYRKVALQKNDCLLLTSDGVHGFLKREEIQEILAAPEFTPQEVANALDRAAAEAGSDDNRSCLVLRIDSLPEGDSEEVLRRLTDLSFPPDLSPGMILDGLRIEREIHSSKRSQLYLVRNVDTEERLVMKTPSVNFEDDPDYIERFALEQWVGQRTNHPNLARIVRTKRPPSCLYHLIEHIDGRSLDTWLEEEPRAIPEIVAVIRQVIAGTRALHRRETLHQDLKPDNVLITQDGAIKLIDYGSARIAGIAEIAAPYDRHSALGTVPFAAPEYRLGIEPSSRSDLFSIAMLAYHLFTGGQHPYGERWSKASSLRDFTILKYRPAFQFNPLVPPWLDAAMQKSLRIRPSGRHECMSEFLHDLEHPNARLTPNQPLPLAKRNPVLLWQLISLGLLLALLCALLFD